MAGMAVHAWSISYCDATTSDGFIPDGAWPSKKGFDLGVKDVIKAGLWEPCDGGFRLHDFTDYNHTKDEVAAARASSKVRKERWQERVQNASGTQEERRENGGSPARAYVPGPGPINYLAGGPGMAGPISPETIPESGDYPGARAREDDLPDEVRATLSRPSIGRKFDRQPGMPASPSNTSQETEKYDVAVC